MLHNVMNHLVFAVFTNCTLVVKYEVTNPVYRHTNTKENCARAFQLTGWLPRLTVVLAEAYSVTRKGQIHIQPEHHRNAVNNTNMQSILTDPLDRL